MVRCIFLSENFINCIYICGCLTIIQTLSWSDLFRFGYSAAQCYIVEQLMTIWRYRMNELLFRGGSNCMIFNIRQWTVLYPIGCHKITDILQAKRKTVKLGYVQILHQQFMWSHTLRFCYKNKECGHMSHPRLELRKKYWHMRQRCSWSPLGF